MRIIRPQRRERRPQFLQRETINARIHFSDRPLLGRRSFFFHDRLDAPFRIPHDPAVICRILKLRAQHSRSRFASSVCIEKRYQRFAAQQRRISWHHKRHFRALPNRTSSHLHRMPCAVLRFLQNHLRTKIFRNGAHFIRLMPNDNQNLRGLKRQASADHMLDQRASTRAMKHLRKLGTHPRPLARGKNHDRCVGMVWHRPLLWRALPPLAMAKPVSVGVLRNARLTSAPGSDNHSPDSGRF